MNRPANDGTFMKKHKVLFVAALDRRLSRGDLGVLMVILEHSDKQGRAFPGAFRIAKFANLNPRSVKRSVAKLARTGFLTVRRRELGLPNLYIVDLGLAESAPCVTGVAGDLQAIRTPKSPPRDNPVLQPRDADGLGGASRLSPELASEPSKLTLEKSESDRANQVEDRVRTMQRFDEVWSLLHNVDTKSLGRG